MLDFCVSLTSIPPRFKNLDKTIDSILRQTLLPKKILVNIPTFYKRFSYNEDINYLKKFNSDIVEVVFCKDYGPGTKILGSIDKISNFDFVLLIDDDHKYKDYMCESFLKNANKSKKEAYSFHVYKIDDLFIGQGADGFLINTRHLNGIKSFYEKFIKNNDFLFFHDDLWISIYLNKICFIDILSNKHLLQKNIFNMIKPIYKKHIKSHALTNIYSKKSRIGRGIRDDKSIKEYRNFKKKNIF
jgi:hypothetical protein